MSILRAALLASSSSIPPSCRPGAAAPHHLCQKGFQNSRSHGLWFGPQNAAPPIAQQQHFRIWVASPTPWRSSSGFTRPSSSSTSCCWRLRWWEAFSAPLSSFRTLNPAASPAASLSGWASESRGKGGCSCRAAASGGILKWRGENSPPSSTLLNFSDHQQRPYATGAGDRQPAAAASFSSALGGRRIMRSRGNGGSENGSGRTSSPRAAFAEDDRQKSGVEAPLTDLEKDKFKEVNIKQTNKLFTLPTVLTLARVAAVPAILAVFYSKDPWATSAGAVIFVLAAVTDWLDGYLARKMGSSSAFGAFLDPVADKLMVAAALVLLCTKPLADADLAAIPWLLPIPTIAIIGREITMSAVREWAAAQGGDLHKAVAVNSLGKIKTASQMISITLLLASGEGGVDSRIAVIAGVGLLYVAAFLALWSLAMYMRGIWGSMFK